LRRILVDYAWIQPGYVSVASIFETSHGSNFRVCSAHFKIDFQLSRCHES
jgi:hypothetical protein